MIAIALGLLPVFLLIALGTILKRAQFPGDALWPPLERIIYFVLFPPLLFQTIVTANLEQDETLRLGAVFLLATLAMTVILVVLRPLLPMSGAAFSSVVQGSVRWSSFVTLGIVAALLGPRGVALAAVAFATMVPVVNVISVLAITRYAGDSPAAGRAIVKAVLGNPLIIACVGGALVAGLGIPIPDFVLKTFKLMGDSTVALGLIAVGAALDFRSLRGSTLAMTTAGTLKLAVMPLLTAAGCLLFGVTGDARTVAIICAATPPATTSYILARQLGGDATLMATLVTVLTVISMVTLPLAIGWLG